MAVSEATAAPESLRVVTVPAVRLHANSYNPNRMNEIVERAERESIESFGFIDPITVMVSPDDPDMFMIIDGEHRWRIGQEVGYTEFPVVVLDVTLDQAKKLTVVLNETRGDADVVLLGQLLNDLKQTADSDEAFVAALPYSTAELEHLLSIGAQDWDQFAPGGGTGAGAGTSGDHQLLLDFDTAGALGQFLGWLEILRDKFGLEDDAPTRVVAEAVRQAAES